MDDESPTVSSERLAELAGVNAAKVRKDLSYFGSYGTRGVGYDVEYLLAHIRRELGLTHDWPCVIAGMGNLGQALANYGGFTERGFVIAALVDADAAKVGTKVENVAISHVDDLDDLSYSQFAACWQEPQYADWPVSRSGGWRMWKAGRKPGVTASFTA